MNSKLLMNFSNNFSVHFFKYLFFKKIHIIFSVTSTDDRSIFSEDDEGIIDDLDKEDLSRRIIYRALIVIIIYSFLKKKLKFFCPFFKEMY